MEQICRCRTTCLRVRQVAGALCAACPSRRRAVLLPSPAVFGNFLRSRMLARSTLLFKRQVTSRALPFRSALVCTNRIGAPSIGSREASPPPTAQQPRPLHSAAAAAAMPSGELPAALQGLQPEALWRFFGELSTIPRPSKHEHRCDLATSWWRAKCAAARHSILLDLA